jgi:septal ring factor EnvC (AmiA/AmiB activator)
MKKILILLFFSWAVISVIAQPRPAPKPAAAPVAKRPSGPSPYVLKKDYDSLSTSLRNQMRAMQGTLSSVRGSLGSKDQKLDALANQMKQVVEVLNSTNFKISLTSDSLTKTRTSIEEVQAESKSGISELKSLNEKLNMQVIILWVLSILSLLLAAFIWISTKKQIKASSDAQLFKLNAMERSLLDTKNSLEEELKNFESKIETESRSSQHYTERQSNVLKDNLKNMNEELKALSQEVQLLKDKK